MSKWLTLCACVRPCRYPHGVFFISAFYMTEWVCKIRFRSSCWFVFSSIQSKRYAMQTLFSKRFRISPSLELLICTYCHIGDSICLQVFEKRSLCFLEGISIPRSLPDKLWIVSVVHKPLSAETIFTEEIYVNTFCKAMSNIVFSI